MLLSSGLPRCDKISRASQWHNNTTTPLTAFLTKPSGCHTPILMHKCVAAKVGLRKTSHMLPSCCYVATSERRRIRMKADYYCIALRGVSIKRSQRGNSEAVFFRWYAPLTKWLLSIVDHLDCQTRLLTQTHHNPLWLRPSPLTYRVR